MLGDIRRVVITPLTDAFGPRIPQIYMKMEMKKLTFVESGFGGFFG